MDRQPGQNHRRRQTRAPSVRFHPLGLVSFLAFSNPESAHIIFCNQFAQDIYFAAAYEQFKRDGTHLGWISRGWQHVPTGSCWEFDSAIAVSQSYWRAETNLYQVGNKMHRYNWPLADAGDKYFWDVVEEFQFYRADERPKSDTATLHAYKSSAYSASGPISVEITITKDAEVATSYDGFPQNK